MKKKALAILLTLLLALGLAACGGSARPAADSAWATTSAASGGTSASSPMMQNAAPAMPEESAYRGEAEAEMAEAPMAVWDEDAQKSDGGRSELPDGVKMIYRANLELETQEFDRAASDIAALVNGLGGYFEEQSTYNRTGGYRSASYTVRVPAERFEAFLHQIGEVCTVTYRTQSAEDVSERYYDTASRLETAKIKLDRLQELLAKAENMEDIITVESAISETEYQIENLSGELRHYDALIGYSTIYVNLQETYQLSETQTAPLTFGERMSRSFRNGLRNFRSTMEDLAIDLAYSWLGWLVFIAVVVAAVLVVRTVHRRVKAKRGAKSKPTETAAPAAEENKQP